MVSKNRDKRGNTKRIHNKRLKCIDSCQAHLDNEPILYQLAFYYQDGTLKKVGNQNICTEDKNLSVYNLDRQIIVNIDIKQSSNGLLSSFEPKIKFAGLIPGDDNLQKRINYPKNTFYNNHLANINDKLKQKGFLQTTSINWGKDIIKTKKTMT